jgi:predicted AAA+ superfamily ATPase
MAETIVKRNHYLDSLKAYAGKPVIKVLVGIRRSGKSTLLSQLSQELGEGMEAAAILRISFDELEYLDVKDADDFKQLLDERLTPRIKCLIFDEVQLVQGWERVVNALFASKKYDIYLTGSNSTMLSSELSTLLSGRYVEIPVQPLTFSECRLFDPQVSFDDYIALGGFPVVSAGGFAVPEAKHIVSDIFNSILVKDIIRKYSIRDVDLFNRIVRFVFRNIGHIFSAKSVADYCKSQYRKVAPDTVYSYLRYLQEANILTSARRYDLRGKNVLKTLEKYYLADHSLLVAQTDNYQEYLPGILENIVFNELRFRGYDVYVGTSLNAEIDFVAIKGEHLQFIQVAYTMESEETFDREIAPLRALNTAWPRLILSYGKAHLGSYDGIESVYLPDWLLSAAENDSPNEETIEAIQWARDVRAGKKQAITYDSPEEFFKDLGI